MLQPYTGNDDVTILAKYIPERDVKQQTMRMMTGGNNQGDNMAFCDGFGRRTIEKTFDIEVIFFPLQLTPLCLG